MLEAADAEPAHLDQAGQGRRRPHQQTPVMGLEMDAVVADEAGEAEQAGFGALDERERKLRLARSRRSPDQHGIGTHEHGRSVHARRLALHHIAGSRTMKRAPSTRGVPSAAGEACVRFSTQMRPPCASMICLEIDRPSPEFWPKAWCGRWV